MALVQRRRADQLRSCSAMISWGGLPPLQGSTICRLDSSVKCLGCFGSAISSRLSRVPSVPHETVRDSVANPDGWSRDC